MPSRLRVNANILCKRVIQARNPLYYADGSVHGPAIEGREKPSHDGARSFSSSFSCVVARTGAVIGAKGLCGNCSRPTDPRTAKAVARQRYRPIFIFGTGDDCVAGGQLPSLPARRPMQDGAEVATGGVGHCSPSHDRKPSGSFARRSFAILATDARHFGGTLLTRHL